MKPFPRREGTVTPLAARCGHAERSRSGELRRWAEETEEMVIFPCVFVCIHVYVYKSVFSSWRHELVSLAIVSSFDFKKRKSNKI